MASQTPDDGQKRAGKHAPSPRPKDGPNAKPKRKPRDRTQHAPEHAALDAQKNPPTPSTPPRPNKAQATTTPLPDQQHLRSQTKARKNSPAPPFQMQPPPPPPPQQHQQPATSTTPAKPVQIYAGPTFHASPAPSSLPIPKLFSKSLPQVNDKDASLQHMLHSDVSEDSSEADGSPTRQTITRPFQPIERQESPLDLFFQKDREEKARKNLNSSQSSLVTPPNARRAQSTSPGPGSLGHSKMRPPDGSMFAFDMDGYPSTRTPPTRLEDSPSIPPKAQDVRSAEARAKTEALKNLLRVQSPDQRRSASESNSLSNSRSSSRPSSRPSNVPPALEHWTPDQTVSHPQFTKQPFPPPPGSTPRQNARHASQLRQQLDQVAHDHHGSTSPSPRPRPLEDPRQQPVVPTPPASAPIGPFAPPPSAQNFANNGAFPSAPGTHQPSHVPAQSNGTNTAAMEEQLRRILKLDSMPSTGIQS